MVIILKEKLNNKDPLKFNVVSNTQPTPLKTLLVLKIILKHYIYPTLELNQVLGIQIKH
jgi:hypothetical protein